MRSTTPTLVIDSDHLDYIRREADLKGVVERIRQALRLAPFQAELPLDLEERN